MTETPAQKPFPSSESHADGLSTTPLGGDGTGEPQKATAKRDTAPSGMQPGRSLQPRMLA